MSAQQQESCRSSVVEHPLGKREADGSIPSGSTVHPPKVAAFFWSKVCVLPSWLGSRPCWDWKASVDRWGYGQFKPGFNQSPLRAHRVAWEIWHGEKVPQ